MKIEEIKKELSKIDPKSEEFWDIYKFCADQYWEMESPDDFSLCVKLILGWLDRSVNNYEDHVIVLAKISEQLFMMRYNKTKSCTGTIGFKGETFFFDVYTSEVNKDKLNEALIRAGKNIEKGNFTVKNKFGKNYFKKK